MKGYVLPREMKNCVINRPNETIYLGYNKLPTIFQKRAFIGFLYRAKNALNELKKKKEEYIIPEKFNDYWESYLWENMPVFDIDLKFLLSVLNYGKNDKKKLAVLLDLMKTIKVVQIKVKKEKEKNLFNYRFDYDLVDIPDSEFEKIDEITISNMVTYVKISFSKEKVYFALSPEINQYLYYSKDYTQMNIFIPSFLNSPYTIELYEILLDKFNANTGLMKKNKKENKDVIETGWIEFDVFRQKMAIKENDTLYQFKYFKRELKRWIEKINKADVIEFVIEDFKTKRENKKVSHLKFYLKPRNINEVVDDYKEFRNEILKKVKGKESLFIEFNGNVYEIKNKYLYKDGKLLPNQKALETWQLLSQNQENINIIENKEEFEKTKEIDKKEQLKQELLRAYFGKKYEYYTKNALGGDELLYYEILKIEDITFKEDGTIDLITFIGEGEDGKHYRLKVTLNQLKQNTK